MHEGRHADVVRKARAGGDASAFAGLHGVHDVAQPRPGSSVSRPGGAREQRPQVG